MHRISRLTPSPALVVATIALLVALGGTAVAAVGKLAPPNSVGTAAVIDNSLLKKDFKAGQLPTESSGGALAFAHVNRDGTLDAAASKNVTAIPAKQDTASSQFYCFDVTGKVAPRNVVATLEYSGSGTKLVRVFMTPAFVAAQCEGKADAVVAVFAGDAAQGRNAFYVLFN